MAQNDQTDLWDPPKPILIPFGDPPDNGKGVKTAFFDLRGKNSPFLTPFPIVTPLENPQKLKRSNRDPLPGPIWTPIPNIQTVQKYPRNENPGAVSRYGTLTEQKIPIQ
jgi:hypothetical protein